MDIWKKITELLIMVYIPLGSSNSYKKKVVKLDKIHLFGYVKYIIEILDFNLGHLKLI